MTPITFARKAVRKLYSIGATPLYSSFLHKRNRNGIKKVSGVSGPIISLTSYHKRFNILYLTIESLINQNYANDYQIVVTISDEDVDIYGGLPDNISSQINRGVRLIRVKENIKSHKKVFYISNENEKSPIITVDDDILYPNWWLSEILNNASFEPDCVLAFRGHHIIRDENEIIFDYGLWFNKSDQITTSFSKCSFLPTGTSGVYYPVGSLKGLESTKNDFLELCPHADDLWLKYITTVNGFKAKRIRKRNVHFLCSDLSDSLHTVNVHNGGNDIQFKKIIEHSEIFRQKVFNDATLIS